MSLLEIYKHHDKLRLTHCVTIQKSKYKMFVTPSRVTLTEIFLHHNDPKQN
jgi:hypothetical protein